MIAPPYSLSPTLVSFIFVLYLCGTLSSTWMGHLADNYVKQKILRMALFIMLVGTREEMFSIAKIYLESVNALIK